MIKNANNQVPTSLEETGGYNRRDHFSAGLFTYYVVTYDVLVITL